MQRLEDVFILEDLQIIDEGKSSGVMKIRGTFQRADEENNNKRIYPSKILEREIKKLQPLIKERRLLGELDHPKQDTVSLSNVSHLITDIQIRGKEIIGEAEILNTPMGNVAQALIKGGVKIGISSRGLGTLVEGEDGKRYVNEDFKLITWDLVADPSTRGAFPGLTESTEIQEILDDVLPRVTQNKILTTVLTEAIREERDTRQSPRVKAHLAMLKKRDEAKRKFRDSGKTKESNPFVGNRKKIKENKDKPIATDHRHYEKDIVSKESYSRVKESLAHALLEFDPKHEKKRTERSSFSKQSDASLNTRILAIRRSDGLAPRPKVKKEGDRALARGGIATPEKTSDFHSKYVTGTNNPKKRKIAGPKGKLPEALEQALLEYDPKKDLKFQRKTGNIQQHRIFSLKKDSSYGAVTKDVKAIRKERNRSYARGTGATKTSGPRGKLPEAISQALLEFDPKERKSKGVKNRLASVAGAAAFEGERRRSKKKTSSLKDPSHIAFVKDAVKARSRALSRGGQDSLSKFADKRFNAGPKGKLPK